MHTQEKDFRKVLEDARNQRLQKMQQQQFYEEEDDEDEGVEAPRYEESPKQKKQTYKPQRRPIGKPMIITISEKPHEGGYGLVIIAIAIVLMTIATLVK